MPKSKEDLSSLRETDFKRNDEQRKHGNTQRRRLHANYKIVAGHRKIA